MLQLQLRLENPVRGSFENKTLVQILRVQKRKSGDDTKKIKTSSRVFGYVNKLLMRFSFSSFVYRIAQQARGTAHLYYPFFDGDNIFFDLTKYTTGSESDGDEK